MAEIRKARYIDILIVMTEQLILAELTMSGMA